jgi:hypothetical protein
MAFVKVAGRRVVGQFQQRLRRPAMATGVATHVWRIEEIVGLLA